jgi:hypothetical protein
MTTEISQVTGPSAWASALVNNDYTSFSLNDDGGAAEIAAIHAFIASLRTDGWRIVDVARGEDGEAIEPRFTWLYDMYGGLAQGGDVVDYVIARD